MDVTGEPLVQLLHGDQRDRAAVPFDDPVGHAGPALGHGGARPPPGGGAGEGVRPAVAVRPAAPGADHHREEREVDGCEPDRAVGRLWPGPLEPAGVVRPGLEVEGVVSGRLDRRRDPTVAQPVRGGPGADHDQPGPARLMPDQGPVEPVQLARVDGVGQAGPAGPVRAVDGPQEVPEQRPGPGVHERAALDQHDQVVLAYQAPDGGREHRRDRGDPQAGAFAQVATQLGLVEGGDGQEGVRAEHGAQVGDIRLQQRLGAGVVRAVVPDQQHAGCAHDVLPARPLLVLLSAVDASPAGSPPRRSGRGTRPRRGTRCRCPSRAGGRSARKSRSR